MIRSPQNSIGTYLGFYITKGSLGPAPPGAAGFPAAPPAEQEAKTPSWRESWCYTQEHASKEQPCIRVWGKQKSLRDSLVLSTRFSPEYLRRN